MLPSEINLNDIKEFVDSCGPETKLYIGCDSERVRVDGRWHADYTLAGVVHINGN